MTRRNPRRPSAKLQIILTNYLSAKSLMRRESRPAQIKAAAKQIQRSGSLPIPVAKALGLERKQAA